MPCPASMRPLCRILVVPGSDGTGTLQSKWRSGSWRFGGGFEVLMRFTRKPKKLHRERGRAKSDHAPPYYLSRLASQNRTLMYEN